MTPDALFATLEATWPAARLWRQDGWTLRDGAGGGKRVSAATIAQEGAVIARAEAAMAEMGQAPLFMIRPCDTALDGDLAALGYEVIDPSVIFTCPVAALTGLALPRVTVFTIWEPLAIMNDIWATGGIGPARLAVMDRVQGPRAGLLGRHRDSPAGAGFVAVHDGTAMVHALEILPNQRRQGIGAWMMRGAALWAAEQGAHTMSVICTRANAPACALYTSLGMTAVGQYHYRLQPMETA